MNFRPYLYHPIFMIFDNQTKPYKIKKPGLFAASGLNLKKKHQSIHRQTTPQEAKIKVKIQPRLICSNFFHWSLFPLINLT